MSFIIASLITGKPIGMLAEYETADSHPPRFATAEEAERYAVRAGMPVDMYTIKEDTDAVK